jgi:hypothetical protein
MRVALVVSDLTYPAGLGLHQQTMLTARLQIGRGDEVHVLGYCDDPQRLDPDRIARETGLRFHTPTSKALSEIQ